MHFNGIRLQPAVNIKGAMKAATAVRLSEETKTHYSVLKEHPKSINSVTSFINGIQLNVQVKTATMYLALACST